MSAARALAEAALSVARERQDTLRAMRRALLRGDDAEALRCARELAGVEEGEDASGDRPDPRLD